MLRAHCLALVTAALLVGCSDDPAVSVADAAVDDVPTTDITAADVTAADAPDVVIEPEDVPPPDRSRPPDVARTEPDEARATQRQACTFGPGAWAAETVGREVPVGEQMLIDHIIVVMQENRSFDHYFRRLPQASNPQPDVDVAADDWTNPRADGTPVRFHHDTERCIRDGAHGWNPVHRQYNDDRMDGFVVTSDPAGDRALTYFDESDIPFYYALATTFAIGDRYFSSLLGPTAPNRIYLMAGNSFGLAHNTLVSQDTRNTPVNHLFSSLDAAGVSWKDYAGGPRMLGFFPYYGILRAATREHYGSIDDLHRDLAAGTLPAVTIVEPNYVGDGGDRVDEHPPGIPMQGERYVERIVRSLMTSPPLGPQRPLRRVRRARRLRRPRRPARRVRACRAHPAHQRHARPGALRSPRRARALPGRVALRPAALGVAPHLRPRVHPALHRGVLRAPRAHPPRRQRQHPDGPLRLRQPPVHDAAHAAVGRGGRPRGARPLRPGVSRRGRVLTRPRAALLAALLAMSCRGARPIAPPDAGTFVAFAPDFAGFRRWQRTSLGRFSAGGHLEGPEQYAYINRPRAPSERTFETGTMIVRTLNPRTGLQDPYATGGDGAGCNTCHGSADARIYDGVLSPAVRPPDP
jgi:hypothetical protein